MHIILNDIMYLSKHVGKPTRKKYRRDMEPPDGYYGFQLYFFIVFGVHLLQTSPNFTYHCFNATPNNTLDKGRKRSMLRLRGGGDDNPSSDSKYNEIPYLSNSKFLWDGLPCIDFDEKVMYPLNNGLASMSVKGATLLQTVKDRNGPLAYILSKYRHNIVDAFAQVVRL